MQRQSGSFNVPIWRALMLAMLVLTGCKKPAPLPLDDESFRLPRKVAGTSDAKVIAMMKRMNRSSVINVLTMGQNYLISMPSTALFPDESPRLTWKGYGVLNQAVMFMKQFRKVAVNVTSYSNQYVSVAREQALTSARARAVADYLWSQGIDSRFVFTEGAGSDKPVTAVTERGDRSPNSRIEITFRDTILN